jgi:hypothetical protein
MENKKEIRYLNKDFNAFRENLINFAKVYFPQTFNDFQPSDPGMMFIEMAAYVGDVLSFYLDTQLKEMLLEYANERNNVINIAQSLGYKPRPTSPAKTKLTVYQLVPATGTNGETPDFDYALNIDSNMQVSSNNNNNIIFRTTDRLNFAYSSSYDPTNVSIYSIDNSGNPTFYLLEKEINIEAGIQKTKEVAFGTPLKYQKIILDDTNIISIDSVVDSDNNVWYEVDYLAQDTIISDELNIDMNNSELVSFKSEVPYLLKMKKVPRRFITRYNNNKLEMHFGAGISDSPDEEIIPNPDNVGLMVPNNITKINQSWDLSNFMYTSTYGLIPHNTTLTIKYTVGGGVTSNINSNTLNTVYEIKYIDKKGLDSNIVNLCKKSLAINNKESATGGKDFEDIEEIRHNAMSYFSAQGRAVTKEDYIIRSLSMPSKYGAIAKSYVVQDDQLSAREYISKEKNPSAINMYILAYNEEKKLVTANRALKENLRKYIDKYRMLTDSITIKDAYVVNIGIKFEIIVLPNYLANDVISNCIKYLKDYFNIDNWQINQPIYKKNIINGILSIAGVQTVTNLNIVNLFDDNAGYVPTLYNISAATINDILYPSVDPMIFEIRFPDNDIWGKAITF